MEGGGGGLDQFILFYYVSDTYCVNLTGLVHTCIPAIFVEGLGNIFCGMWGTGVGTTTYSENVGAIGITKVRTYISMLVGVINYSYMYFKPPKF